MDKKKIASAVAVGVALGAPLTSFAQVKTVSGVVKLFDTVFNIVQYLFWVIAGIFIIYAAFKYLTAQGDPEKVGVARQMVIYAVIAIAIALLAMVMDDIIENFLGGGAFTETGSGIRP